MWVINSKTELLLNNTLYKLNEKRYVMSYCSNAKRESPHSDSSTATALQIKKYLHLILQCMFLFI